MNHPKLAHLANFLWFFSLMFLTILHLQLTGCVSSRRAYRDPLTYSFEQEATTPSPGTEWRDFKGKIQETTKKIRAWEDRILW